VVAWAAVVTVGVPVAEETAEAEALETAEAEAETVAPVGRD